MKKTIKSLLALAVAAFAFTACSDVPEPEGYNPNTGQFVDYGEETGNGSYATPYNVAAAARRCVEIGATLSTEKYFVTGYVYADHAITADELSYGNVTFEIVDDLNNPKAKFKAYQVLGSDGAKLTEGFTVKRGDNVVIYGPMYIYKGEFETGGKGVAQIFSLNGKKTDGSKVVPPVEIAPIGDGTFKNPFNVTAAIKKCQEIGDKETSDKYYVKGYVVNETTISESEASFGNISFDMYDAEGGEIFKAYQVMGSKGAKLPSNFTLAKGAEVVIYGPIYNFKGTTPETVGKGAAQIFSVNGKATDGGEVVPPIEPDEPSGDGLSAATAFNISAALAKCKDAGEAGTADKFYVKGIAQADATPDATYGNATIKLIDKEGESEAFTAYQVLGTDSKKMPSTYTIKKGDVVIVYGKLLNYKGNTPETEGKGAANIVSVNGQATPVAEEGGGEGGGGEVTGTDLNKNVSENVVTFTHPSLTASTTEVTVDFTAQGWTNGAEATTVTLPDGTTIAWDKGSASNPPRYYDLGTAIRMYSTNKMIITSTTKKIAKVVMNCDSQTKNEQTTNYVGNEQAYGKADGKVITIVNDFTSGTGGTQLRPKTMTITYATE